MKAMRLGRESRSRLKRRALTLSFSMCPERDKERVFPELGMDAMLAVSLDRR